MKNDNQILANYFYLKPRRLQIFRVQQHGTATILWTKRADLLRYLQNLGNAAARP